MITNSDFGTTIDEIETGVFRISTPIPDVPGGFSFNQYLILDRDSLLFHTGPRRIFPLVREAIETVLPLTKLSYVSFSHAEADECGALNEFLAVAPRAVPLCGRVAAMVSIEDMADRPPRVMGDGEELALGSHSVRWVDAPHLPHGWDCGFLMEHSTQTLLCGDLFTQGGATHPAVTEADILEPSEAFRKQMDYHSHTPDTPRLIERLASLKPRTLACMHGSAWRGDGSGLLVELGRRLQE
jgi:flavorubredoxin